MSTGRGLFVQNMYSFLFVICLVLGFASNSFQCVRSGRLNGDTLRVSEAGSVYCLFRAGFLLGLHFDPEHGVYTFLRNFGRYKPNRTRYI
jgi:hypothetical protein